MRRRLWALVAALALCAWCLVACQSSGGGSGPQHTAICVKREGHDRVKAENCTKEGSGAQDYTNDPQFIYIWWYVTPGQNVPAIGDEPQQGSGVTPKTGGVQYPGSGDDEDENGGTVQAPADENDDDTGGSSTGGDDDDDSSSTGASTGGDDE